MVPADLLPLALEPGRLVAMVDPARGLSLLRNLDCEREDTVDETRHACGRDVSNALEPLLSGVQQHVRNAISYPETGGISCRTTSGPRTECTLGPFNECEPIYLLVFDDRSLIAVVERDDWQESAEVRQPLDQRVAAFIGREQRCP